MKSFPRTVVLALTLVLPPLLGAADEKTAPPKTHVLFMGADLSVQRDNKVYRVEDITGSELKIHVDQQEVLVPTRRGPVGLQVNAGLKVAGISVQLDQLKSGPAYTYENDPTRKIEEATHSSMNAAAAQDMAQIHQSYAATNMVVAETRVAQDNGPDAQRQLTNARLDQANVKQEVDITDAATTSDVATAAGGARRMALAEGSYDAMEVSFKISSLVPLEHPYMVILFRFHAPDAKPGVDGMVIHAEALDPVDAAPRYVRVLKGGLPIGFKVVDCTVHIYNRGQEVATNLSAKRVEMTHDETQLYLVMEHIGAHKGATLAAAAVPDSLPRAQRQGLSPEQLKRRLYVKVSKDGLLLGAYTDENCSVPLDDARATTALGAVFFTPALEQGKPVEGVARVRLGDI